MGTATSAATTTAAIATPIVTTTTAIATSATAAAASTTPALAVCYVQSNTRAQQPLAVKIRHAVVGITTIGKIDKSKSTPEANALHLTIL